jgi:hypothetical protein
MKDTNMKFFNLLGTAAIALTLATPAMAQEAPNWKILVRITGQCQYKLFREVPFVDCDSDLRYGVLPNGRAMYIFSSQNHGTFYTLSGGADRQPRLEDYYLTIDTFRMMPKGKQDYSVPYEGECHDHSDKSGREIRLLECEAYNRQIGMGTSLRVTNARVVSVQNNVP